MDLELAQALERILALFNDITFVAWAAPLVVMLTALAKRFIPINAGLISLVFQAVIWIAYVILKQQGLDAQFQSWVEAAIVILQALLPLITSMFAAKGIYAAAVKYDIPALSYRRS